MLKFMKKLKKNPDRVKKEKKKVEVKYQDKQRTIIVTSKGKYKKDRRLTHDQRKERVAKKIQKALRGK